MIDWSIRLQPIFPIGASSVGFVLLLSFFIWKEINRKIKFLTWRIIATALMMLAILGLLLQPSLSWKNKSNGIALLTPHYSSSVADSFRTANPSLTFLRTADTKPYPSSEELSLYDLVNQKDSRFVLGDGLPTYVLEELEYSFQYFASNPPIGIVKWQTSAIFKVNQQSTISGLFHSLGKSKIILKNPSGAEDSIEFTGKGIHSFQLNFTPRQSGLFVYEVITEDSLEIRTQKFPVEVEVEKKLSILFFQKYPTAEVRYLKNYLIDKGHALAIRSQISRNNFRYEYAHRKPLQTDRLNSEMLESFDLFLIDNESFESLSAFEIKTLEESVKAGLGIVVLFNSIDLKKRSSFLNLPLKNYSKDTVWMNLITGFHTFSTWPFVVDANVEEVSQTKDRVLSGHVAEGSGKIGFQLLQETYRLLLEGKTFDYASLWTPLLERVARSQNSRFKISIDEKFPISGNEPLSINVIAAEGEPHLSNDGISLPLREDVVIDDYWHGKTWATELGWHRLTIENDSTQLNYYVSDSKEWQSLHIAQQQSANRLVNQSSNLSHEIIDTIEHKPISSLLFFLVFLVSAGFLWLLPKL